jgi:hypothetical protein
VIRRAYSVEQDAFFNETLFADCQCYRDLALIPNGNESRKCGYSVGWKIVFGRTMEQKLEGCGLVRRILI